MANGRQAQLRQRHGGGAGPAKPGGGPAEGASAEKVERKRDRQGVSIAALASVLLLLAVGLALSVLAQRPGREEVGQSQSRSPVAPEPQPQPRSPVAAEEASARANAGPTKRWWEGEKAAFNHPEILTITTQSYNKTVTATEVPLLIAFYDPRSMSYQVLRHELLATADALARLAADGNPVGRLGSVDVTVHTWLSSQAAPELSSSWQDHSEGAFRFQQPRFWPMILHAYANGQQLGEYKGVVKPSEIIQYMVRLNSRVGGEALESARMVSRFLQRPGPLVMGCGMEPEAKSTTIFMDTAKKLHGMFTFASLAGELCQAEFGPFIDADGFPRIVWSQGNETDGSKGTRKGIVRSTGSSAVMGTVLNLTRWLSSHRTTLDEMTPDTSHVHLDQPEPMILFLLDSKMPKQLGYANSLVGAVETALRPTDPKFQFVWSECRTFVGQFEAKKKDCPMVVMIHTGSLEFETLSMEELVHPDSELARQARQERAKKQKKRKSRQGHEKKKSQKEEVAAGLEPWQDARLSASERLVSWIRDLAPDFQREPKAAAEPSNATAGKTEAQTEKRKQERDDADDEQSKSMASLPAEARWNPHWYSKILSPWTGMTTVNGQVQKMKLKDEAKMLFVKYHALAFAFTDIRASYQELFGSTVPADFSRIDQLQADPELAVLGRDRGEIAEALGSAPKMRALWQKAEARATIATMLDGAAKKNFTEGATRTMIKKLAGAHDLITQTFTEMMEELVNRDRQGNIDLPRFRKRQVDRRHTDELSISEFMEKYAKKGEPVIITGLNISDEDWSLDFFRDRCNKSASLVMKNSSKTSWGRLQHAGKLPLAEFIDTFTTNETRKGWYLHDWSLLQQCPEVFGHAPYRGFVVPKYFAGDYFQRSAFVGYQHAWPSLFIGSEMTESALHVDSGQTNFWMHLLSGRKEWRFFSRRDLVSLYSDLLGSHFYPDVFRPDYDAFPLLKYAEVFEGIQEPGDLIFIPGGNPHGVRNLEPIHGVSMNYVDASNLDIYLRDSLNSNNLAEFEQFTDNFTMPLGVSSKQQALSFGEWKSTAWREQTFDIF